MAAIIRIKTIGSGDLIPVIVNMRKLLTCLNVSSFDLYADFSEIDPDLGEQIAALRRTLDLSSERLMALLQAIEKTEAYQFQKSRTDG